MNNRKTEMMRKFAATFLSLVLMAMLVIPGRIGAAAEALPADAGNLRTPLAAGNTYYVSSTGGDDANDGMAEDRAWATLEKVNGMKFQPGDRILFKAGDVWNGSLKLRKTSGTEEAPIVFSSYGNWEEDGRPQINGNGTTTTEESAIIKNYTGVKDKTMSATIDVVDGSYLEFSNFELTNFNPDVVSQRAGINIRTASTTVQEWEANSHRGIVIRNNYIHDVDGNPKGWKIGSGGILILGNISDVLVEGNIVKRVDIEGIRNAGLYKEGDINANFPRVFENVIFNNNYVEEVQGDGFVMSNVGENGRMEYNTVVKHSAKNVGNVNYAGLWVIGVKDMVMQYNEVYGGIYGYNDGQAFDIDMFCEGTLYQYNYSHSNRGGFILFMGGSTNSVVRYNVSVNDGDGRYLLHYLPKSAGDAPLIHNNTFFTDSNIQTRIFDKSGIYARMYNNIFYTKADTPLGATSFAGGEIKNNIFYPGTGIKDAAFAGVTFEDNIFQSPKFARPGEEPKDIIDAANDIFDVEQLNGYKLLPDSPAIHAGLDMSGMTPSVWPMAAKDFFDNPLTDGRTDIGAHEYSNDEPVNQAPEILPESLTLSHSTLDLYAQAAGKTLTATITPQNAWFKGVKWSSSDPLVATVSENGFVMPMKPGEAMITAESTADPDIRAQATVTVHEASAIVSYQVATDDTELSDANPAVRLRIDGMTEDGIAMEHAPFYQVRYTTNDERFVVDSQTGTLHANGNVADAESVEVTALVQEYQDLVYSQSFEAGWGDFVPESGTQIQTGTISDRVAYHGGQSALFVKGDGSNAIQKLFGSKQQGIVTMMMYDDGSKSGNTRVVAHVGNARSTLLAGMGVLYDGSSTYGSLDYYSVRASGNSQAWEKTSVERSKGWHEFKWDYTSGIDLKMYIDGQLVKTTTGIKDFDRIVLGFLWDSANGRTFAFDNIKYALSDELESIAADPLLMPVRFVDKAALEQEIAEAQSIHDAAVEGSEPGQYPEGSKSALAVAIAIAQEAVNKAGVTQTEIDDAMAALHHAVESFKSSVIRDPSAPVDKTPLLEAISVAQAVYDSAVEGTEPGQYPAEAVMEFHLAIEAAKQVTEREEVTQAEIDAAVAALNAAIEAFGASMIPEADVPTWKNGRLTAGNVTKSGMNLSWSGEIDASQVTAFKIFKNGAELSTVPGTVYQYQVTGLNTDTTYTFKVEASNELGTWSTDGPSVTQKTKAESASTPNPSAPSTPVVSKPDDKDEDQDKKTEGEPGTGGETGETDEGSKPEPEPAPAPKFIDTDTHWAASLIEQAAKLGIVQGYEDQTFRPNGKVTRAEFAAMLGRALKWEQRTDADFADKDTIPQWARPYVSGAAGAGIIQGYEDGTFRPALEITRTELVVMIVRALALDVDPQAKASFADADRIPAWAEPYVAAAYDAGLIQGRGDGKFAPNDPATRAEAVKLILAAIAN